MAEKKKEEEREEEEKENIKIYIGNVEEILRAHEAMRELVSSLRIPQYISQMEPLFKRIELQNSIFRRLAEQAEIMKRITISPHIIESLRELQRANNLLKSKIMRISKEFKMIPPKTISDIKPIIPPITRTDKKLLNYVEMLEAELAKEREKNKALLKIIEESKKRLKEKPEYIT